MLSFCILLVANFDSGAMLPDSQTQSQVVVKWVTKDTVGAPETAFLLLLYRGGELIDIDGMEVGETGLRALVKNEMPVKLVVEDKTPLPVIQNVLRSLQLRATGHEKMTVFIYQGCQLPR